LGEDRGSEEGSELFSTTQLLVGRLRANTSPRSLRLKQIKIVILIIKKFLGFIATENIREMYPPTHSLAFGVRIKKWQKHGKNRQRNPLYNPTTTC
jgi:hypothetical protein